RHGRVVDRGQLGPHSRLEPDRRVRCAERAGQRRQRARDREPPRLDEHRRRLPVARDRDRLGQPRGAAQRRRRSDLERRGREQAGIGDGRVDRRRDGEPRPLPARLPGVRPRHERDGRRAPDPDRAHREGRAVTTDRVTMSMTNRTLLANIESAAARVAKAQAKLSSGKELNAPSDDPYAVGRALQLRSELGEVQQYQRNVSDAQGLQQAMDTTLSSVNDYVLRARDLVVQGANGALGQSDRNAIADEIDQITDGIKSAANARYGDQYIFGGTKTTTAPYSTSNDTYSGNSASIHREIARGADVNLSID